MFQGSDVFNLSIFMIMPFCFNDVKKQKTERCVNISENRRMWYSKYYFKLLIVYAKSFKASA